MRVSHAQQSVTRRDVTIVPRRASQRGGSHGGPSGPLPLVVAGPGRGRLRGVDVHALFVSPQMYTTLGARWSRLVRTIAAVVFKTRPCRRIFAVRRVIVTGVTVRCVRDIRANTAFMVFSIYNHAVAYSV